MLTLKIVINIPLVAFGPPKRSTQDADSFIGSAKCSKKLTDSVVDVVVVVGISGVVVVVVRSKLLLLKDICDIPSHMFVEFKMPATTPSIEVTITFSI
jgi:hypothetical protein